jgi:hypothetical protein
MKLGAFNTLFFDRGLPEALQAKAVEFLKDVMIDQPRGAMWWD